MALAKREAPKSNQTPQGELWTDPEFQRDYPSLYSFLNDCKWDDGSPRCPGSMSLFTQIGCLKAAVNDKERRLVAFVNAATMSELFALIDQGVCDDSLDWKGAKQQGVSKDVPF